MYTYYFLNVKQCGTKTDKPEISYFKNIKSLLFLLQHDFNILFDWVNRTVFHLLCKNIWSTHGSLEKDKSKYNVVKWHFGLYANNWAVFVRVSETGLLFKYVKQPCNVKARVNTLLRLQG